jgi:hypothetical protein
MHAQEQLRQHLRYLWAGHAQVRTKHRLLNSNAVTFIIYQDSQKAALREAGHHFADTHQTVILLGSSLMREAVASS